MSSWKAAVFIALSLFAGVDLSAQTTEPVRLQRLVSTIRIDGTPDESAWQQITPLPMTMHTPVFRGTPTQRTEIRITYDDDYLYCRRLVLRHRPEGHSHQLAVPRSLERR